MSQPQEWEVQGRLLPKLSDNQQEELKSKVLEQLRGLRGIHQGDNSFQKAWELLANDQKWMEYFTDQSFYITEQMSNQRGLFFTLLLYAKAVATARKYLEDLESQRAHQEEGALSHFGSHISLILSRRQKKLYASVLQEGSSHNQIWKQWESGFIKGMK